jgi:hypothetical protein
MKSKQQRPALFFSTQKLFHGNGWVIRRLVVGWFVGLFVGWLVGWLLLLMLLSRTS